MRLRYSITIILVFVIVGSGLLAWSTLYKRSDAAPRKEKHDVKDEQPILDTALLSKVVQVSEQFDLNKHDLLLVGKLSVFDGADSLSKIVDAPYIFSKKGNEFYFKLGHTETINAKGLYLFVDHELKKIMVGEQKDIMPILPMPDAKQLLKNLKGEGYTLSSNINGNTEKIAFKNSKHLSCKEYALFIDQENKLNRVLLRLSNMPETEDPKKDKLIDLKLSKFSNDSALEGYINQLMVVHAGNSWKLAAAYQHYELITR